MADKQNQIVAGTQRGDTTINVQQLLNRPWYHYKHLRKLYGWLSVVLLVQATNGFDGSLMNVSREGVYIARHSADYDTGYANLDLLAVVFRPPDRRTTRYLQWNARPG